MERVLVVWCPDLLEEQEDGRGGRAFGRVMEAVGVFSPAVEMVQPGVCAVGTRGPSRYFGGDERFAGLVADAVAEVDGVTAGMGVTAGVGVADGLFAAVLAARAGREREGGPVVVAPGGTPGFLGPWPVTMLERPELADLLVRLGIRTLGRFAGLPSRDVLARFGVDGASCHRVAQGISGELPGFRPLSRRNGPTPSGLAPNGSAASTRQPEFWGGEAGAAARAGRALARVQELVGPEAVVTGRLQGGRGPAARARVVPWSSRRAGGPGPGGAGRRRRAPGTLADPPWPGQVPPPAPVIVLVRPLGAQLVDAEGKTVGVSGGGMVTDSPARLSVDGGPWTAVTGWAGPWPSEERWWSVPRRQARMQVVTGAGTAHLLTRERGGWWLEGTYD